MGTANFCNYIAHCCDNSGISGARKRTGKDYRIYKNIESMDQHFLLPHRV